MILKDLFFIKTAQAWAPLIDHRLSIVVEIGFVNSPFGVLGHMATNCRLSSLRGVVGSPLLAHSLVSEVKTEKYG